MGYVDLDQPKGTFCQSIASFSWNTLYKDVTVVKRCQFAGGDCGVCTAPSTFSSDIGGLYCMTGSGFGVHVNRDEMNPNLLFPHTEAVCVTSTVDSDCVMHFVR